MAGNIYFILNKLNGKYYIGKTIKTPDERWIEHVKKTRQARKGTVPFTYLYKAIDRYGPDNFEVRTLFTCSDESCLEEAERYFIYLFNSHNKNFGYNCTLGGDGGTPTEEIKQKISMSRTGKGLKSFTLEHRLKISKALTGRKRPVEDCIKMSRTRKGRKLSESTRNKMRASHLGKPLSANHIRAAKEGKENAKLKRSSSST